MIIDRECDPPSDEHATLLHKPPTAPHLGEAEYLTRTGDRPHTLRAVVFLEMARELPPEVREFPENG